MLQFARKATIEELKAKCKTIKDADKAAADVARNGGKAKETTNKKDAEVVKMFTDERKVLFFKQMENCTDESINVESLGAFLREEKASWN